MDEERKITTKITVGKSFINYISRCIDSDFKEGDLERGFTVIKTRSIGGTIYYKRPPKEVMVKAVFKKRNMKYLDDKYKEILPELIYFT